MSIRCLYRTHGHIRVLTEPDLELSAWDNDSLFACIEQIQQLLQQQYRFVCGLLPYEAGGWRFPPAGAGQTARFYLYKEPPDTIHKVDPKSAFSLARPFQADQDEEHYFRNFKQIQAFLKAGDCYQVNFAQRFSTQFSGDPVTAWLALDKAHPAPHSCYFDAGDYQVFGVSPERFLSIHHGVVVTEPIKGSRPRGRSVEEDDSLANDLVDNPKDLAENLMIVDLLRNDLGACCLPGSVKAAPLFQLRRFSNVQHLVSTVKGKLRPDMSPLEALVHAFPGGSITGAPKKRAMEIIAELEPVPRGAYCGSFFTMDDQGNLDSNILIRTMQTQGDRLYCHGGGGIVFDSNPRAEYEESCFKVKKLMESLEQAFLT